MKKGPFKLKSGNKPSMAKLAGVSPMKYEEPTDRQKRQAIFKGMLANWNKKNPNASQEEMNAYIRSVDIDKIPIPTTNTKASGGKMKKGSGIRKMEPKEGNVIGSHTAKFTQKKKGFDFTGTGNFKFPKDYDMKKYSDYTKYDDDRD